MHSTIYDRAQTIESSSFHNSGRQQQPKPGNYNNRYANSAYENQKQSYGYQNGGAPRNNDQPKVYRGGRSPHGYVDNNRTSNGSGAGEAIGEQQQRNNHHRHQRRYRGDSNWNPNFRGNSSCK